MKARWKKSPPELIAAFDAAIKGRLGIERRPFAPGGRPMREYVVLPPEVVADRRKLGAWLKRSIAYVETLPAKRPKRRS